MLRASSSSLSFVSELHLPEGFLGTAVTQRVLPQPCETLCFQGRQHQTQKVRTDLSAWLVSWPYQGPPNLDKMPFSVIHPPYPLYHVQIFGRYRSWHRCFSWGETSLQMSSKMPFHLFCTVIQQLWPGGRHGEEGSKCLKSSAGDNHFGERKIENEKESEVRGSSDRKATLSRMKSIES